MVIQHACVSFSAGVGRTGTFITLEMISAELRPELCRYRYGGYTRSDPEHQAAEDEDGSHSGA